MKALDPSYGQMSSAADLTRVTQMLLNAETDNRLLRSSVVREWLRPSYAWIDDTSEVGLLWEIIKLEDSFGRIQRVYQKSKFAGSLCHKAHVVLSVQWAGSSGTTQHCLSILLQV